MIILFIINSVFYILITVFLLTFYYGYKKDIEDCENRLLQLEKRTKDIDILQIEKYIECSVKTELLREKFKDKEGDKMACKKGRGGRKK